MTIYQRILILSSLVSFLLPLTALPDKRSKEPAYLAPETRWRAEPDTSLCLVPSRCSALPLQVEALPLVSLPSFPSSRKLLLDLPGAQDKPDKTTFRPSRSPSEHPFWDRRNDFLFAAVGASRTLDYFSTLNMRRRGDQEIFLNNDVVDNNAAFAVIEAAGTAISIGASYLFHHYHHHRLERWTSIVHTSLATSGAVRNYCLSTAHSSPAP